MMAAHRNRLRVQPRLLAVMIEFQAHPGPEYQTMRRAAVVEHTDRVTLVHVLTDDTVISHVETSAMPTARKHMSPISGLSASMNITARVASSVM